MDDPENSEQPWIVTETDQELQLCHDYRWLALLGIPMAMVGLAFGVGVWFLPGIDLAEAWPMLAVGSLIGLGPVLIGLHLSLNREWFIANKSEGVLIHRSGFGPLTRERRNSLAEVQRLVCEQVSDPGSSGISYVLVIVGETFSKRIASFVDPEPILFEGLRWSYFLDRPLSDHTQSSRQQDLARGWKERKKSETSST